MAKKKDSELTVREVKNRYEAGIKDLRGALHDYWLNHAFMMGHQWLWYNPESRRLDELPRDPDRVQATINRFRANSRTVISKIMQRELEFEVLPTAADDATTRGARTAEAALAGIHQLHDWEGLREMLTWTTWKGGTGAVCVDWDPEAGNYVAEGPDNQSVFQGDTKETVLSIAEFVVEAGSQHAEKARFWIKAQAIPPADVKAAFGLKEMPKADATAGMTPFQQKLLSTTSKQNGAELVDLTMVLTYYERPNADCPSGRVAVIVGDEFVDGPKPWPFPFKDRLNLAISRESLLESKWFGDTILSQARTIQTALNASWSSIIEHMKLAGNARLFVPQSSMDLIEQLSDMAGEIVPYPDGLQPPAWGSPPQMPAWWIDMPDRLGQELDDIMGAHAISRGDAPVNIESGFGLSILAEQDATPMGRLSKEMALMWGRVATMVLKLYEANVKDTRQAIVRTPGQPPESARWSGKDLQGQTTAEVPLDAVLPRSRAAMQATADKMMQMGLITEFSQYARIAELPNQHDLLDAVNPDVSRARRENASMAQGKVAIPMEIDDHEIHMREHRTDMKSVRFELLTEAQKQVYYDHIQAHETMAAEEAARMAAKAAINPVLATVPDRAGAPGIPPDALAAMTQGMMPPGAEEPGPEDSEAPGDSE